MVLRLWLRLGARGGARPRLRLRLEVRVGLSGVVGSSAWLPRFISTGMGFGIGVRIVESSGSSREVDSSFWLDVPMPLSLRARGAEGGSGGSGSPKICSY